MPESAYKLGYGTGVLLRIYLVSGIVVGILSTFSFNSPKSPSRCTVTAGEDCSLGV